MLLTALAERHNRTAQEALKERLKIPAFATPEIATVLFLQVRRKRVQVGGWSSRTSSKISVAVDDLDHLRLHTSTYIYIYCICTHDYTHIFMSMNQ